MSRIEDQVCAKIQKRAEFGLKKYGTTMEREDFTTLDWMEYLQEELMDALVYLERLMGDFKKVKILVEKKAVFSEVQSGQYQDTKTIFGRHKEQQEEINNDK